MPDASLAEEQPSVFAVDHQQVATVHAADTEKCINWLDQAGLVQFDDPQFPNVITFNTRGITYAEQLLRDEPAARGKAGGQ
ncbi:hypothetical protein VC273_21805 [Xanthomonas nasturtii]|uniref:hypothetical protein n=1 Tax=Xanthomonas TaxID=338 RepID=UPI002B2334C7|nr:hypothetical protein [Xanthomonas nasturtii]MEA9558427.1 hypothetical protein [Xanthomonas nasturtii]